MEFRPYDDYFHDQRVFNDDAKVGQTTFVLTGNAYHWFSNLHRLVTHRLGSETLLIGFIKFPYYCIFFSPFSNKDEMWNFASR